MTDADINSLAEFLVEQRYGSHMDDEAWSQLVEAHEKDATEILAFLAERLRGSSGA